MKRKNPILILSVLAVVSLLGLGLLGRTNHRVEKLRKSSLRARIKSVSYVDSLKSPSGNDSEPQSLMVKLKPVLSGMDVKTLFQSTGFAEIEPLYDNVYRFQGKDSLVPLNDLMEQLRNNPAVELVEKDVVVRAMDAPNDPYFLYQFYLYNHGQTLNLTDGTVVQPKSGADINVVDAWTFSKGSEEVKIGVLDSGADYNHPPGSEEQAGRRVQLRRQQRLPHRRQRAWNRYGRDHRRFHEQRAGSCRNLLELPPYPLQGSGCRWEGELQQPGAGDP